MPKIPFYRVKGSAEEIGFQHGSQLKERIHACFRFYRESLFTDPNLDLEACGTRYLEIIGQNFPTYETEIRALAEGAEMKAWQIAALNARTEIHIRSLMIQLAGECTTLYLPKDRVIGQNWDWMRQCEDLIVLMEIEQAHGHKILMLAEPGIIGKVGMNSCGMGVCLNILHGKEFDYGVPIHILLRAALDSTSLDEAQQRIRASNSWTFSNIFLADDRGEHYCLELEADRVETVHFPKGDPVHTNHYLGSGYNDTKDPLFDSSGYRLERARQLAATRDEDGVAALKKILLDRENGGDAICSSYHSVLHFEIGTVTSVVMDLPARSMHLTSGNPIDHGYHEFHLKDGE